jgi:hypothetical protein
MHVVVGEEVGGTSTQERGDARGGTRQGRPAHPMSLTFAQYA